MYGMLLMNYPLSYAFVIKFPFLNPISSRNDFKTESLDLKRSFFCLFDTRAQKHP